MGKKDTIISIMSKCPYIYKAEDRAVQIGKRTVGEVCGDSRGSAKYNDLCMAHARSTGVVPPEQVAEEVKARHEKTRKSRELTDERIFGATASNGDTLYVNKNVLEAMNLNDPCDLETEFTIFKAINQNPGYENYSEKMAFARWLRTPKHLRNPQIIEEAAPILGVTSKTLYCWKTAPDVVRFINMEAENHALSMFPFAMYKLGCGVDRGDATSIKLYKEWYEEKMASRNKKEKRLELPDDIQKEADEYGAATGKQNRGQSLVSEKNMVIDNHFAGTGLIGENEQ